MEQGATTRPTGTPPGAPPGMPSPGDDSKKPGTATTPVKDARPRKNPSTPPTNDDTTPTDNPPKPKTPSSASAPPTTEATPTTTTTDADRTSQILHHLSQEDSGPLPPHLQRKKPTESELASIEKDLLSHPFFIKQADLDDPTQPLPPLVEALQQLKYSPLENTPHDLAVSYKEDALYNYNLKKYRIAATLFTHAITNEQNSETVDPTFLSTLFNNRSACQFFIQNHLSSLRDAKKALQLNPSYQKAFKRALDCCVELKRFEEGLEILKTWNEQNLSNGEFFLGDYERVLKKGEKSKKLSTHLSKKKTLEEQKNLQIILETIRNSGIKMESEDFVYNDDKEMVPRIDDDQLRFPVVLFYPEHSQSDFVRGWGLGEAFLPHLLEVLDTNPPDWDTSSAYRSDKVDVYWFDKGGVKWVKVEGDLETVTLGDVLSSEGYLLPPTGSPGFFILSKESDFCKFFLQERLCVD